MMKTTEPRPAMRARRHQAGKIEAVLAASDLGPASDEVVRAAAAVAEMLGAELHLLNALEIERLPALEAPIYPQRVEQARDLLAEQAHRLAPAGDAGNVRVMDYAPDRAIPARAAEVGAGLIVLGPHRGGEARARVLGTTAEAVIRGADVPVLVVGGRLHLPVRRIGVPTDFSQSAGGALELAFALAGALGGCDAEVHLFHVAGPATRMDDHGALGRRLGAMLANQADASAPRACGSLHPVRTEVVWGARPTDAITDYARTEALDLLVVGTQGHGRLRRLFVGSVASGAARQASCPVLLVPPSFGAP